MKSTDNNYVFKYMFILSIVGIIIKFVFIDMNSSNSTFWGWSIIALSLLVALVIPLELTNNLYNSNKDNLNLLTLLIKQTFPSLSLIFVLIYFIYLNIKYADIINKNIIEDYKFLNILSSILISIQTMFVFFYLYQKVNNDNKYIDMFTPLIYIFSIINLSIAGYMNVILNTFITDG